MPVPNPKRLIVEGYEDLYSVQGLMSAHIAWPPGPEHAPVFIHIGKSDEEILEDGYITTILKAHGVKTVGVMLDADSKPRGRYARIRNLCLGTFPKMPDDLPQTGLVVDNDDGQRLGVWVMPDNSSEGSLETFLKYLVPDEAKPLWEHGMESVAKAKKMGAACRDVHNEKANLFTWLSWQDPPGQKPGVALAKKVLDPHSPSAAIFVTWFRELFQL